MKTIFLKRVLLRDLEGLRAQINAYAEEEQLWEVPEGISNSAGTLALHLVGNLRHFIGAQIGVLNGGVKFIRFCPAFFKNPIKALES